MVIKSNRLLGITASKKQPAKAGTSITSTGGDAGLDDNIKILNASHFSENSASYILKSIYTKSDISTNIKVQMLVKATPEARPLEAIKALERFLTPRVRVFNSKYSLAQRISICQQMTYEYHPCGKFIIKEGHKALNFYIILSGRVDILKQRGDVWIRLNVLGKGDSFGDIGVEG